MQKSKVDNQKGENVSVAIAANEPKDAKRSPGVFEDNRPESVTQRALHEIMSNSNRHPQPLQQRAKQTESFDHQLPIQKKPNDTGLPDQLKSGIENLSGHAMDDVKVHYNSARPAQLNAHAYAQGTDIHLASGQEKHLAHEAWHVVQQKEGRVKPTMEIDGTPVNDNAGLEKEADRMGAKALQMKAVDATASASQKILQRKPADTVQRMVRITLNTDSTYYRLVVDTKFSIDDIVKSMSIPVLAKVADGKVIILKKDEALGDKVSIYTDQDIDLKQLIAKAADELVVQQKKEEQQGSKKPVKKAEVEEEKRQEVVIIGADELDIKQGQISNIQSNPYQGPLKGVSFNSKQVYHISGRYPENGKPLWYVNDKDEVVLIGMYGHPGEDFSVYKKMQGIGPKTINA